MKFGIIGLALLSLGAIASVHAETFFEDGFADGEGWKQRWTNSAHRDDLGRFNVTAGKWHSNPIASQGLQTVDDARFYAISAPFNKVFDNTGKDLVVQFSVKHEQDIDCGGGYVKLLPPQFNPEKFNGDTAYNIMFGPDICGSSTRVHVIFNYKGTNHLLKREISAPTDELTHFYTLIVRPDQTYTVLIDNEEKQTGSLLEDWEMLPPKEIDDPSDKKPADWVDNATIEDPEDKKPEDWDQPETIPDPDAKKPEDWDDDMDGDWEPPVITNPDYKGEWKPRQIPNPAYKGEWKPRRIANPEFVEDKSLYAYNTSAIGIDIWQVKSGTIFDDFLVTDNAEEAKKAFEKAWRKEAELQAKEKFEEAEDAARAANGAQDEAEEKSESEDADEDVPVLNFGDLDGNVGEETAVDLEGEVKLDKEAKGAKSDVKEEVKEKEVLEPEEVKEEKAETVKEEKSEEAKEEKREEPLEEKQEEVPEKKEEEAAEVSKQEQAEEPVSEEVEKTDPSASEEELRKELEELKRKLAEISVKLSERPKSTGHKHIKDEL
ncbi:uncharacterized protein VTP21DRAFT_9176 [Calcarisporiella thermophila]|uniref:uncharacterized protein n=1 Tax=Calcarisporiella thermophila TaxID=911321 RepID=UPI0037446B29